MPSYRRLTILLSTLFLAVGCSAYSPQLPTITEESVMPTSYQTDIVELSKFIQLPAQPIEARWQTAEKGTRTGGIGPTDYEGMAVLEYDTATVQLLRDQMLEQTSPTELYVTKDFVKPWFPHDVQQMFVTDSLYPEYLKLDGTRYQPSMFAKGSLLNGYVVTVGKQVFVYLHTL